MSVGFSFSEEGALLIGGPEDGQVVRVKKGTPTVQVREHVEIFLAQPGEDPQINDARIGVYARRGNAPNFYWRGWQ